MSIPPSTLAIDGHVHIYKEYDWADALTSLLRNLSASPHDIPIGLLAEGKSSHFFKEVAESTRPLVKGNLQVEAGPDSDSLVIRENGIIKGYLIAGRQLVTLEKLEVLALGKDTSLSSGQSLEATLESISREGAIPVLSWSPGKWFFGRGKLVSALIDSHPPGSFMIGDIGLRPTVWTTPCLMKKAEKRGFKIMAGSDSLPRTGESDWIGRIGFQVTGAFDPNRPAASLRAILFDPSLVFKPIGRHSSLLAFINRRGRNQLK